MEDQMDKISLRQVIGIFFVGALSLIIKVIPKQTTALSGKGTWVASLLALIPVLFLFWMLYFLLRGAKGRHLGEIYCTIFGTVLGKILVAAYFLWTFVLMCMTARDYADRFLATTYQNEVLAVFIAILLALVFVTAKGRLSAFGRMGEMCLAILLTVLILIIVFSASKVDTDLKRTVFLTPGDVWAAVPSVLPYVSIIGLATYSGFLWPSVQLQERGNRKLVVGWILSFSLVMAVLQIAILGVMGIELVPHLQFPLFHLIKNITVFGVFERLESIIIALWAATDYIFVSTLAILSVKLLSFLFQAKGTKEWISPILLIVFAGSLLITSDSFALEEFSKTAVRAVDLVLCFGVPTLAVVIGKLRRVI